MELKPWQVPLAEHQTRVLRVGRVMLSACHTGSGKTYLACQTIKDLGMPTLVVCPKVAISQWRHVVEGMGCGEHVIDVVNPENLTTARHNPWYSHADGWTDRIPRSPALLVFDEIHRGCSGVFKISKAGDDGTGNRQALMVARWVNPSMKGHKVLAMSATPADSPLKMQTIGYLMGFHKFTSTSFFDWCRAKGCSKTRFSNGLVFATDWYGRYDPVKATSVMKGIRREMGERFMSITPEEIPGFPEETKEVVRIDLAKSDHDALVRAYEEMPERIQNLSQDDMVKLLRLRQQAEFCKAEEMAKRAAELVEDGYSVFVMVNFTDARLRVERWLDSKKVGYAHIYGGQKEAERQAGIDAFQRNETHVMVGMAAACSVALSLHDERHERPRVSLISPGYSASEFSQGLGRIRRVGGTHATQYIVIAADSVEEKVGMAIERKMNNLSALTDKDLMR